MSLIRINRVLPLRFVQKIKCFSTVTQENEEYTTPQYPPILDLSFEKRLERKKEVMHEEIKKVKTVEEKQIKLNMPRYYGFKTYVLLEEMIPYNDLHFVQHITRTHLIKNNTLPDYYNNIDESENLTEISEILQEALLMEVDSVQKSYDLKNEKLTDAERENIISSNIIKQVNRILNNNLCSKYPHLISNELDLDPRLESSWFVGGMNPPLNIKRYRKNLEHMKPYENEPTDRLISYKGFPILTIRSELPLPLIVSPSEAEDPSLEVPKFQYDPRIHGVTTDHKRIANVPGFWPGDYHSFGVICFLKKGHLLERSKFIKDSEDNQDAVYRQGILSSYTWLYAQANHLGFTTFNDITYPLVTQSVLTNGKEFNFFIYQLNTILLHSKHINENPKRNICWASENLKLYEDIKDGKIVGFNKDVLSILIKLYSNAPAERLGVNLRPYLSQEEKIIADYEDDEKRSWLEREYKFLVSNRPRHRDIPEVFSWEKIYKIDHDTRFMDKRRRFFEFLEKPNRRALNDRLPKYIPRALRPDLPKNKGRRANEYWP
ncbi:mitochondrial ribosomal protein S30 [Rhynchophorus ferrugineus]|uniref:mitochondrial ribosomal protein S30 n=1 Tax=Rhynchophorus ferrugineus TaxID=354439 RepID=UPI003FCEB068